MPDVADEQQRSAGQCEAGPARRLIVAIRRQLAEKVVELTGSASTITYLPLPSDDPRQRQPDISKARELLGWAPTVELDQGVMRTITYFDQLLGRGGATATI